MPGNYPPIKLFVDAHVFDKEYQGTRTFIREIYTRLAAKKNLEIYMGACDTANLKKIFPSHANIHFIAYKSRSSFSRLLYTIPGLLKKHRIEYAHFQYIIPPVRKCRYIVTIHDVIFNEFPAEFSFPYRLSKKLLYRDAATRADIITTVSSYSKQSIQKHLDTRGSKIHIIPNGVGDHYFGPYNPILSKHFISEKYGIGKFILYVSRFEPRKNHLLLLQAYLDLKLYEKGYHLVLLGHRTLKVPGFDELIANLPATVQKMIFINSFINDTDLLEFYRAAEIFIYPSKAEGFGISPLEAGALKIPVICSNSAAMKEYTFFGSGHFDPGIPGQLGKKLEETLAAPRDEFRLQRISDHIRREFSWEQPAEKFYQLLQLHHAACTKHKENDQPVNA